MDSRDTVFPGCCNQGPHQQAVKRACMPTYRQTVVTHFNENPYTVPPVPGRLSGSVAVDGV